MKSADSTVTMKAYLPVNVSDHLTKLIKDICLDSYIAKKYQCKQTNISHCAQNISTLDQNIVDKRDGSMEDLTIVCQVKRYGYYLLENFLGLLFFGKISIL